MDTFLAIVQAISACAMAFFSYRLYYVSDQQWQLIARQVDSGHEAERGRVFGLDVEILPGQSIGVNFMNAGRLPLEVVKWKVGFADFKRISNNPGSSFEDGVSGEASIVVLPEKRERIGFPRAGTLSDLVMPTRDDPWYVEVEIEYTSYGGSYSYRWAWVVYEEPHDGDPTKGERYVGSGYERDLTVINPSPARARHRAGTS